MFARVDITPITGTGTRTQRTVATRVDPTIRGIEVDLNKLLSSPDFAGPSSFRAEGRKSAGKRIYWIVKCAATSKEAVKILKRRIDR